MPLRERRTCAKMSSRGQDLHPLPSSLTCLLLLWSTFSAHLHGGSGEVSLLASSPHPTFPRGLAPQTLSWYRGFSLHRNNTVISWNSFDLTACRATCVCTQAEQGCRCPPVWGRSFQQPCLAFLFPSLVFPLCRLEHDSVEYKLLPPIWNTREKGLPLALHSLQLSSSPLFPSL